MTCMNVNSIYERLDRTREKENKVMDKDVNEKMEWVYSALEDEESKFIFQKRRKFNESGDYHYIEEIIDRYVPEMRERKWCPGIAANFLRDIKERGKKLIVWGAGHNGRMLVNMCKRVGCNVECFCDNNHEKQHMKVDNVKVISPEELGGVLESEDNLVIIVSPVTKKYQNEIYDMLRDMGQSEVDIYRWSDYYYPQEVTARQYFDEVVSLQEDEVFVDGGCCDFTNSKLFLERMKEVGLNCKKIYAFEPDKENCQKCIDWIKAQNVECAEVIQAGLWSENTYLSFEALGNGSSHLSQYTSLGDVTSCLQEEDMQMEQIRAVSLDSYIEEAVSFIKLDVEGAELETLKGARDIILSDKPKLAICIYHKKEDLYEIPYYLKKLVPEYKLYIRHYSNFAHETVLYAV